MPSPLIRLRDFVAGMTVLAAKEAHEQRQLDQCRDLLRPLLADGAWLPESCRRSDPERYQQHLIHCDPLERFSMVSFVWGPGQHTPVHDHGVWGVVGMLEGAERSTAYSRDRSTGAMTKGETTTLQPGQVVTLSPSEGDIHQVANAFDDRVSISIHVYGGNIGAIRRHVFDPVTGEATVFVSGYSNALVPNLWDRSADMRSLSSSARMD